MISEIMKNLSRRIIAKSCLIKEYVSVEKAHCVGNKKRKKKENNKTNGDLWGMT